MTLTETQKSHITVYFFIALGLLLVVNVSFIWRTFIDGKRVLKRALRLKENRDEYHAKVASMLELMYRIVMLSTSEASTQTDPGY